MINSIKILIEALREELQNYGEMLALLDRQQESWSHAPPPKSFNPSASSRPKAPPSSKRAPAARNAARQLAGECRQPWRPASPLLIPLLPSDYQPLLRALVDENNQLLMRVRRRARQNHLLLRRSVELMQELLNTLLPSRQASVYDDTGSRLAASTAPRRFYDAVG